MNTTSFGCANVWCTVYHEWILSLQWRHNECDGSQITGVSIICLTVCWGADQRKQPSSASLAFVRGIHRSPVDSPHKGPVARKMFPFDDVIMCFLADVALYDMPPVFILSHQIPPRRSPIPDRPKCKPTHQRKQVKGMCHPKIRRGCQADCVILIGYVVCHQLTHDDVIKWKLFPRYWPFVRGIHRSPVNSPHKGQWRLSKQSWGWWFETPSCPLWRQSNELSSHPLTIRQSPW